MDGKRTPPAPPAKERPAPPAKGRPAPPKNTAPSSGSSSVSSNPSIVKAQTLESEGKYKEAAIMYKQVGDVESENRCLSLALASTNQTVINNIQYGDTNIHDSVMMGDDKN